MKRTKEEAEQTKQDLLNAALAMELKGAAFFEQASADCANPTGPNQFQR